MCHVYDYPRTNHCSMSDHPSAHRSIGTNRTVPPVRTPAHLLANASISSILIMGSKSPVCSKPLPTSL